jgi:hypothetical protein
MSDTKMTGGAIDNYKNISKSILYNRGVLFFVFFLAISNLVFLVMSNDLFTLLIFVLTGFLTSFFSKNMVVILAVSMAVCNIIKFGTNMEEYTDAFEKMM